jgi:hypothetical protein
VVRSGDRYYSQRNRRPILIAKKKRITIFLRTFRVIFITFTSFLLRVDRPGLIPGFPVFEALGCFGGNRGERHSWQNTNPNLLGNQCKQLYSVVETGKFSVGWRQKLRTGLLLVSQIISPPAPRSHSTF